MTEETLTTPADALTSGPDPNTILCRIVDVNSAIQQSFQRFVEAENKTLEDLANIMREEMSKIELFAPTSEPPSQS